jgi:hypothetical protein
MIDNLMDKTHQIAVNDNHTWAKGEFLCFPLNPDDPADFSSSLQWFMEKLSPSQVQMDCHEASADYIQSSFRRCGHFTALFYYATTLLGINKLKELMTQGAKIMGIPLILACILYILLE